MINCYNVMDFFKVAKMYCDTFKNCYGCELLIKEKGEHGELNGCKISNKVGISSEDITFLNDWYEKSLMPKPCPFCGSEDLVVWGRKINSSDFGDRKYVKCNNCDTEGPLAMNKEEAIKKWNERKSVK